MHELQQEVLNLQTERVFLLRVIGGMESELTGLRGELGLATTPREIASINQRHRSTLANYSRVKNRLREVNHLIKSGNVRLQQLAPIQAKRERAERAAARKGG